MIDALAVHKDAAGDLDAMHLSNLSQDEAIELGSKIGALIGLGFEGEDGMAAGAEAGADAAAAGATVFSDEQAWDVLTDIPNDSAAALILLEHHWAVPLQGRATYGSTHRPPGRPTPGLSRGRHRPARVVGPTEARRRPVCTIVSVGDRPVLVGSGDRGVPVCRRRAAR